MRPTKRARGRTALVHTLGCLVVSAGLALAVFSAYLLWGSNVAGDRASAQILAAASTSWEQSAAAAPPTVEGPASPRSVVEPPVKKGDLIGVVSIPSIDVELPVLEGMDASVLDQGVLGHYPGTTSPGQVGNFAVAGHRTTHGAALYDIDRIAVGDSIVVESAGGWDVYTMQRHRIVTPDAVEVIAPVPDDLDADPTKARMVLTSCYPKLSAAKRIIAYAVLDRHVPRTSGPPAELG